ncbi:MFS transporter [Marinomonas sp. PE14-40]|uniref:MFS transporter n=1 Tax=Marinomonas sp. PE14-40 TaxID=3060621 RepID=UPI003F67D69F
MFYTLFPRSPYLGLLSAQLVSLLGTGITSVCLALLAYELAGSDAGVVLSMIFAIKMLTYIFLSPVFAQMARGLAKRKSLILLDLIRAGFILFIPFVTQVWQVYFLMFAIHACSAWFTPQFQSLLAEVSDDQDEYVKALSISRLAFDLEQMLSPMFTALLLLVLSFRYVFFLDAMSFLVSASLLLLISIPLKQGTKPVIQASGLLENLTLGLKNYLSKPSLKALWFAYLAAASASAMVLVNTVVYVHDILKGDESETALAMMLVGLGSMFVALGLPYWVKKLSLERFHWIGMVTLLFAFLIPLLSSSWFGFAAFCVAMGVGMSCIQTTSSLIIVQTCGSEETAPYFAAHFSLSHCWWLITYLVAGLSAQLLGLSMAYLVMSGLTMLSIVSYFLVTRRSKITI